MRSSRLAFALALALAHASFALAACAPNDAPVCAPSLSWAAPAYHCGAAAAPVPVVVEAPPIEAPPADEPPPAPVLATLGDSSIDLAEKIQFETSSAVILPASQPLLDQVALILADHPEITQVRIEGHTDSAGSKLSNKRLSQARADSVRVYLARQGLDPGRMVAKGFGATKPIADNRTAEGRDQNRRVAITILHRAP